MSPFGTKEAKCDLRPADAQCTDLRDFPGPSLITFEGVCGTLTSAKGGGTYTEGARCDSATSLGGCQSKSADGTLQTNWFYGGDGGVASVDDVKSKCDSNQPFVAAGP